MRQTRELEQITIKIQDNGEGTVGFQHRIRVRGDAGERIADGDSVQARIRLADFREQSFEVNGKSITGAEFQTLCGLIGDEMERQAAEREREAARLAREKEIEEKRIAEARAAIEAREKALAKAAEAEARKADRKHRGKAERG